MKVGDAVSVDIAGHKVADAKVKSIGDGQVTLVVPATEVVMAVRTELDPAAVAPKQEATHVVIGTEDATAASEPVASETVATPSEPAVSEAAVQAVAPEVAAAEAAAPAPAPVEKPATESVDGTSSTE